MALRGLGRLHMVDRAMRLKAEMLLQGASGRQRAPSIAARQMQPLTAVRDSGLDLRAQLKSNKVFNVVKDPLAFLHCVPTREKKAFIHEEGLSGSAGSTSC